MDPDFRRNDRQCRKWAEIRSWINHCQGLLSPHSRRLHRLQLRSAMSPKLRNCRNAAKVWFRQHGVFDCGSICLRDKVASSLQEIKFFNNCVKRIGPLLHGDSVLSYICYSKQPQH